MREVIVTPNAPSSPLYSQGIKAGGTVYVSGTVGVDVTTGSVAGPTVQEQTRQALKNCDEILKAGGATLRDVVEVGILLADPDDFAAMNEAYAAVFANDPPARYVAGLGPVLPGVLVSIRMTAVIG
jgi:2-iminobutanoate/2-iminopropanoate deaminase